MISIFINIKKLTQFLSMIIDNVLSIKTLKEIVKNIILFLSLNFFFIFTTIYICRISNTLILGDKFQSFSLSFISEKKTLNSLISFDKFSTLKCKNNHKTKLCLKWEKNEQIVDLTLKKDIFEIQFETKLLFVDKIQSFVYDFNLYNYLDKTKNNHSGFMMLKKEKFYKKNIMDFFDEDYSFLSKKFVIDFRNYNRPSFANLRLKMIKDQTFIKDLIIHINQRTNVLVRFYYDYQKYILFFSFLFLMSFFNFIYLSTISLIYFFKIATFLENINFNKEEEENKIEKTGYMKKMMSLMFF